VVNIKDLGHGREGKRALRYGLSDRVTGII
jgi:hypothetical protein